MQSEDKAHDHFRDFTITGVRAAESGDSWSLSLSDRTGMSLSRSDFDRDVPRDLAPRVGDTVRLYGRGFGHEIRGVDLNSRQLYYRTQAECDLRDWRREIDQVKEQRERFNRERSELDATVAALSAPLRARIERLRAEDPDFRWKWEAMMLPIYVDADLHGGHSGASFGEACQLAFALLAGLPV